MNSAQKIFVYNKLYYPQNVEEIDNKLQEKKDDPQDIAEPKTISSAFT